MTFRISTLRPRCNVVNTDIARRYITHAAETHAMEFNKIANYYPDEEYSGLVILSASRREWGRAFSKGNLGRDLWYIGDPRARDISDAKDTFGARRLLEPPRSVSQCETIETRHSDCVLLLSEYPDSIRLVRHGRMIPILRVSPPRCFCRRYQRCSYRYRCCVDLLRDIIRTARLPLNLSLSPLALLSNRIRSLLRAIYFTRYI